MLLKKAEFNYLDLYWMGTLTLEEITLVVVTLATVVVVVLDTVVAVIVLYAVVTAVNILVKDAGSTAPCGLFGGSCPCNPYSTY